MISRNLYIQILFRVLILVAVALGLVWIIFSPAANILILIPLVLQFVLFLNLVYYLNRMNRRIFYVFESFKNDDSTLSFPDEGHTKV